MVSERSEATAIVLAMGASIILCTAALALNTSLALAWAVSLCLTLAMALGATKQGSLGPFRIYLVLALAVWGGAFTLMHWLDPTPQRLVLGLPPATAASVYLLWLAPLAVVTLPYALYFRRFTLTDADWEALTPYLRDRGD